MRGKGKDPDVSDLLPSVRARGVLVPQLVRPNCAEGQFEIVAGRRSYTAVNAVAREGGAVRSEERRVGKACVRPGRSRWSQYHQNKKHDISHLISYRYLIISDRNN